MKVSEMIKINYISDYEFSFDAKKVLKKLSRVAKKVIIAPGKHYVSVIIVDNAKIWEINKEYRHIDAPTDVISFALADGLDYFPTEMGDIFISYEKVNEQAKNYGHSVLREFTFLACHGILHLHGYDHQTPEEEKLMFAKQDESLNIMKIGRE